MTESVVSESVEGCYSVSVNGRSAVLVCHYVNFHCCQNPKSYANGLGSRPMAGFETRDTGHFGCITDS